MGVKVTKFQCKNLLRMLSKGEGNPGPRVTLAIACEQAVRLGKG